LHISLFKYVLSTMGVSKESISKFLIGNRFHVKLRILSPYSNRDFIYFAWKNTSGGNDESRLPQSSDIGVKAEKSFGESLTGVSGRVFIIHSTSTRKV